MFSSGPGLYKDQDPSRKCGQRGSPATSVNKGYCSQKAISYHSCSEGTGDSGWRGIQDGGGFRMEKDKILALIVKMLIKGVISVSPDSCLFPYTEKHWNQLKKSIVCVCVCVWLAVIFWCSTTFFISAKTPIEPDSSLKPLWNKSLRAISEAAFLGYSPQ